MATSARRPGMTTPARRAPLVRPKRILIHLALSAGALLMLYPLFWLMSSSLKPSNRIFSDTGLWVSEPRLQNYVDGWNGAALPFSVFFINSFIIATLAVVGNVIACSLVAYAFARLNFAFKRTLFAMIVMTIMLRMHATLIPQIISVDRRVGKECCRKGH